MSNTFIRNTRLKLAKNHTRAKQHSEHFQFHADTDKKEVGKNCFRLEKSGKILGIRSTVLAGNPEIKDIIYLFLIAFKTEVSADVFLTLSGVIEIEYWLKIV